MYRIEGALAFSLDLALDFAIGCASGLALSCLTRDTPVDGVIIAAFVVGSACAFVFGLPLTCSWPMEDPGCEPRGEVRSSHGVR